MFNDATNEDDANVLLMKKDSLKKKNNENTESDTL